MQYHTFPAYGKGNVLLNPSVYQSVRLNHTLAFEKAELAVKQLHDVVSSWEESLQFIYGRYRVQLDTFNNNFEVNNDLHGLQNYQDDKSYPSFDLEKELIHLKSFEFYIQYYENFLIHFSFLTLDSNANPIDDGFVCNRDQMKSD